MLMIEGTSRFSVQLTALRAIVILWHCVGTELSWSWSGRTVVVVRVRCRVLGALESLLAEGWLRRTARTREGACSFGAVTGALFLYIDEHHAGSASGTTSMLVEPAQVTVIRDRVLAINPTMPTWVEGQPRELHHGEELHHTDFLRGLDDETKFATWEALVAISLELELGIVQVMYTNADSAFGGERSGRHASLSVGVLHALDVVLRSFPDATVSPTIDAGLSDDRRINAGIITPYSAKTTLDIAAALHLGMSPENFSIYEPWRIGDVYFVDSATSLPMQVCDNLGGLLRARGRIDRGETQSDFVARQAEIARPLVEAGQVQLSEIEWDYIGQARSD